MRGKKAKVLRKQAGIIAQYVEPTVIKHPRVKLMPQVLPDGKTQMVPTEVVMLQVKYPLNTKRGLYQRLKRR